MDRRPRGLTLLEVMLAIGIMAVALLSLMAVFLFGTRLMMRSRQITAATILAQQVLESVRDSGYSSIPAGTQSFDGSIPILPVGGFPPAPYPVGNADGASYTIIVRCAPLIGASQVKTVDVEVDWPPEGSVHVQTYFHP